MPDVVAGLKAVGLETPPLLGRITNAVRYVLTGVIGTIAGSENFKAYQGLLIFWLTVAIFLTGGIDIFVGQKPPALPNGNKTE